MYFYLLNAILWVRQPFIKEAVVWKRLHHPNIVPFLGVTINPFQFVLEWMPNDIITHYVAKNPGVNRIGLESPPFVIVDDRH